MLYLHRGSDLKLFHWNITSLQLGKKKFVKQDQATQYVHLKNIVYCNSL
jgi:hypothetical protein